MTKNCEICLRGPLKGHSRSHSNIATTRWQKLNIQKRKISGKTMSVCTRCLKSLLKKQVKSPVV